MQRSVHYIKRSIGSFTDQLICLWEGNDLPTFAAREPYYFDHKANAERVANRLAARYSETDPIPGVAPALPISYSVETVEWDDSTCPCCGNTPHCSVQHVSQFVEFE